MRFEIGTCGFLGLEGSSISMSQSNKSFNFKINWLSQLICERPVIEISESITKKLKLNSESQNVEQEPIFPNFSKGEENEENNDRESENSLLSEMN